jgi:hypothetical protein
VGGHVLAYFRDESDPLSAPTATANANANAGPAAAGTDGSDPVTEWARQQTAYYQAGTDPVSQWAQAQNAYYRAGATQTAAAKPAQQTAPAAPSQNDPVAQWAAVQTAYYRTGDAAATEVAETGPVAAGTDGIDVTTWAAEQTAYYRAGSETRQAALPAAAGTDGVDVSAWAAEQTAYYRAGVEARQTAAAPAPTEANNLDVSQWAAEQTAFYKGSDAPVAADDPVAAWAQRQTAYYRAGSDTTGRPSNRPAASPAGVQVAQVQPAETPDVDVSTWARDQMAWVMGDRAKEMAALPATGTADHRDVPARAGDRSEERHADHASGAVAEGGGWFQDNIIQGWTRHQAAQQLAEPGYRPDLAVPTGGR